MSKNKQPEKLVTFKQKCFTKTFNGDPQVGFVALARFYAPFGLSIDQVVTLRKSRKMSGSAFEYSTDGVNFRSLPIGREI
jgi:hypothetical protein